MQQDQNPRLTPWVVRLLAANAVVLLLQQTLFTSSLITDWLRFDPAVAFQRPWTFFTYMFLHSGLLHLAANSLALFVFGPPVERRLGPSRFIFYYLYCGLGGAVLSLLLSTVMPIGPFIGASGAVLGLAVAYGRFNPDAELVLFPIPFPIKARTLVWLFAALAVFGAMAGGRDGIAHIAHLGGLVFGLLYFAAKGISREPEIPHVAPARPRVPVGAGRHDLSVNQSERSTQVQMRTSPPRIPEPAELEAAEIDRLLDKISASGISSLSAEEKEFLDAVARRKREQ